MAKVIFIDTDYGLKSLAPDSRIEEVFGYKPRRAIRSKTAIDFIDKILEPHIETTEDVFGQVEQEYYRIRKGIDVNAVVIDTLTGIQQRKRRELKAEKNGGQLAWTDWEELGDTLEDLVMKTARSNITVIYTGHTKIKENMAKNTMQYIPSLTGRMQSELPRHLDIIAYTHTIKDENDHVGYYWQIESDEERHAKCRFDSVTKWSRESNGLIPQDYGLLSAKIKDEGYDCFKMLVLGETGTGKTYSLRTLKNLTL